MAFSAIIPNDILTFMKNSQYYWYFLKLSYHLCHMNNVFLNLQNTAEGKKKKEIVHQ